MKQAVPLFTPLKTKRVFEEIADQIRELIYSGVFKPGDKLPSERELANQFKAGRMVVREALRTLEHAGFIYIKQGSFGGAFIKESDSAVITRSISDMIRIGNVTLDELTETRLAIEMIILESAFQRINEEDLEEIRKNLEESREELSNGKRPLDTNLNFHLLLAKASKNTLFEMMIKSIMSVTTSFLLTVNPEREHLRQISAYHTEIYDALKKRNFKRAKETMKEHLVAANERISELAERAKRTGDTLPSIAK
jgi:GntR family transcriptional regulator, transcriptional repressor for pyruvate dehydrogenase complex